MSYILRVDMGKLEACFERVPEEYVMIGGRGLTSQIIADGVPPNCEPLGRHNKLVIAPGLLGGTGVPSSGRLSVGGVSPLTGGIKEANAGGTVGHKLARLGIKALVIEGKPTEIEKSTPYVMRVAKDACEIIPWRALRYLGVYETAARLQEKYGNRVGIILIGPAGERLMSAAGITNTDSEGVPSRYAARGGLGAVMGSKGVKAIVVDDAKTSLCRPSKKQEFDALVKELAELIRTTPQTAEVYPKYGTAAMVDTTNALGALPTRNFSTGRFEKANEINGVKLRETILERGGIPTHACMPGCLIRCSNVYVDKDGKTIVSPLEYETIGLLGSNCGIGDLDKIAQINWLCNDYGVDTLEVGGSLGVAMEAGLLEFGDADKALELVREIGRASVLGRVLGQGGALTARVLGILRVPAVKGQTMPAYEPRSIKGLGVTYATSPMAADHTAGNTVRAQVDHHKPEGQVEASRNAQVTAVIYDVLGMCNFVGTAIKTRIDLLASLLSTQYGVEWTADKLRELAQSTLRTEIAFNRAAGLTEASDRLPEWFCEEENPATKTRFDVSGEQLHKVLANI